MAGHSDENLINLDVEAGDEINKTVDRKNEKAKIMAGKLEEDLLRMDTEDELEVMKKDNIMAGKSYLLEMDKENEKNKLTKRERRDAWYIKKKQQRKELNKLKKIINKTKGKYKNKIENRIGGTKGMGKQIGNIGGNGQLSHIEFVNIMYNCLVDKKK